jgi:hypothetical protein
VVLLNIGKWVYSKWVRLILRVELRFVGVRKIGKTETCVKLGSFPSELHERGCKTNRKTRPVVPVTVSKLEKVRRSSFLTIFEISEDCKILMSGVKC